MKKIFAVMIAAMMLLCCGMASAEMVGMPNPWTEVADLAALNAAAGTNLQLPPVMGVTDVACRMMQTEDYVLAEVSFRVNGVLYNLRGAGCVEDISGYYMEDGKTAFEGIEYDNFGMVVTELDKLARWLNLDGQYVLMVTDNGEMDTETFESIVHEMMQVTNSFQSAVLPDGMYFDEVSMRAWLSVEQGENDTYAIEVHWANSAVEDNVWAMNAVMMEDGSLVYNDCVKQLVTTAEDGTQTIVEANLVPDGYFMLSEGKLLWTGAAEEACHGCVFAIAGK